MSEELMPDKNGRFGIYGGRYVAETLVPALEELSEQYELIKNVNQSFFLSTNKSFGHLMLMFLSIYFDKIFLKK